MERGRRRQIVIYDSRVSNAQALDHRGRQRRSGRGGRVGGAGWQQIVEIERAVLAPRDLGERMRHGDVLENPRAGAKGRKGLELDVQAVQPGKDLAVGLRERESADGEREGVGVDFDLPHRCLAMSQRRQPLEHLGLDNGRDNEKARQGVGQRC